MVSPVSVPLPRAFGRYVLLRRLSRGGMGEIFLAKLGEIRGFEKLCTVKKVLPHLAADREFIARFVAEAQIAIKLAHPNIAMVHEVGMVDGEYFLAMEYVEGRDLRRLMARCQQLGQRIPPPIALYVVRELASALAYAHRKVGEDGRPLGLVHCDVSPPNVLVSYEGSVKVIDFGIAKSRLRLAETNPRIGFGKLGYMAPEQLLQGQKVDRRADLYAAGVVLYELLTGRRPITIPEGADHHTTVRSVTHGEIAPPSSHGPELEPFDAICLRALARGAGDRFQSGEALRDAVSGLLARIAPTMSGDGLGEFLQAAFAEERRADQKDLAEVSRAAAPTSTQENALGNSYEDDAKTRTVTFALAEGWFAAGEHRATATDAPVATADASFRRHSFEERGPAVIALLCLLVGGGLALAWWAGSTKGGSPAHPGAPTAPERGESSPVRPALPSGLIPPETTTPLRVAGEPRSRAARQVAPGREDSAPLAARPPAVVDAGSTAAPSRAQIEARFEQVKREYTAFQQAYGQRLEDQWNRILEVATFGQGSEKLVTLARLLDDLERRMHAITQPE